LAVERLQPSHDRPGRHGLWTIARKAMGYPPTPELV
jgi:hypothetical protein